MPAAGLAIWWISGGVPGLLSLGNYYCMPSAARHGAAVWKLSSSSRSGRRCWRRTRVTGKDSWRWISRSSSM